MRKYSLLHPFVMSFFSADFYRDVARHWRALPFLFLLILLSVTWIPVLMKMQSGVAEFVEKSGREITDQIPPITIRHGEVVVEAEQPYTIADPETGEAAAILDTTGEVTSLAETPAHMLLTHDTLITKGSAGMTREYPLAEIEEFRLDSDRAWGWMQTAARWIGTVLYPFALAGSYVFRVVQCLLYALVGLLFARMRGASLSYLSSTGLAIMAVTPVVLLSTLMRLTSVEVPYEWALGFALAMVFLWFGVRAATAPEAGGTGATGEWSAPVPQPPA